MTDFATLPDPVEPRLLTGLARLKNEFGIWYRSTKYLCGLALRKNIMRTAEIVYKDYNNESNQYNWNMLSVPHVAHTRGHLIVTNTLAFRSQFASVIHQAVTETSATNILEFGCGEGDNMAHLSRMYPDSFSKWNLQGFDLVPLRVSRAHELMQYLGLSTVVIWQGDATIQQVAVSSVDLVYSVHAIEQLQQGWREAIIQMRNAAPNVLLIEPFYERKTIHGKLHSRMHGYFRGFIREILDIGFEIKREYRLDFEDPFNRSTALLLTRK